MRREDDQGSGREQSGWKATREGPGPKMIAAGLAVLAIFAFVLQNTSQAKLAFLFWNGDAPLWSLVAVTALLGFAVGWLLGRGSGTRRAVRKLQD